MGFDDLKDFFPTIEILPNLQCFDYACRDHQREYILVMPARDVVAKGEVEAEAEATRASSLPVNYDNEQNISFADDDKSLATIGSTTSMSSQKDLCVSTQMRSRNLFYPRNHQTMHRICDLDNLRKHFEVLIAY